MNFINKLKENRELKLFTKEVEKSSYPIIPVDSKCIKKYKEIRNNNFHTDLECIKKINRNYRCGSIIGLNSKYLTVAYGCLYITYSIKQNRIVDLVNHSGYEKLPSGYIDFKLKQYIDRLYKIED